MCYSSPVKCLPFYNSYSLNFKKKLLIKYYVMRVVIVEQKLNVPKNQTNELKVQER